MVTKKSKRLSKKAREYIGRTVTIKWGTSRGRDSYGYTTCNLYDHLDRRVAGCNGGGYDMKGTVVGYWIVYAFADELRKLKLADFPENSHWVPSGRKICRGACLIEAIKNDVEVVHYDASVETCPKCGEELSVDHGERVQDPPRFYGLTFHDPNYDPGKAVVSQDVMDRTLGGAEGMTVEQAEKEGRSIGLERYQAVYRASSPVPTKRHTIPSIDGACGLTSVLTILRAIGLDLKQVVDQKKLDVFEVVRAR